MPFFQVILIYMTLKQSSLRRDFSAGICLDGFIVIIFVIHSAKSRVGSIGGIFSSYIFFLLLKMNCTLHC